MKFFIVIDMYFFTLLLLVVLAHLTVASLSAELSVHADLRLDLSFESQCTISS